MNFKVVKGNIERFKSDLVAIGCFEKDKKKNEKPKPAFLLKEDGGQAIDKKLNSAISKLIQKEKFLGSQGDQKLVLTSGLLPSRYVLLLGLGKKDDFNKEKLRGIGACIIKTTIDVKAESIALVIQKENLNKYNPGIRISNIIEGMLLGAYKFEQYKSSEAKTPDTIKQIYFLTSEKSSQFDKYIKQAISIADATNLARDMGNTPGLDMTPAVIASCAKKIATKYKLGFKKLGLKEIKKQKMGAYLAVAQGSEELPVFIHLSYKPKTKPKKKIALIGKGITFDSGGISLKPPKGMEEMKDDMGGAAAVLGIIQAVAQMKLNIAIDVYIAACENMPSGKAIKPGDIVKARSGKTIEIISTDAEGRLTLADAISYARDKKPDFIIDLATLTGHCVYGVGEKYAAILGNDQKIIDDLLKAGKDSGDFLWQFPLEQDYKKGLKKGIADLKNSGTTKGGTVDAALFLEEFVGDSKWAHLDIAPTAWNSGEHPYTPMGATGAGVRVVLYFLMGL